MKWGYKMEKYLLLKLGMNLAEVEKILGEKLILERCNRKRGSDYFLYYNETFDTFLNFSIEKILYSISFHASFSLAVDGIKIGMNMNEVEKIKGLPETQESSEYYPEMEEWFYPSTNTAYLFIENKVYDITLHNFSENYLTKDDVETLVNAVSGVNKIENWYFDITSNFEIENSDFKVSSSFDNDKSDKIVRRNWEQKNS